MKDKVLPSKRQRRNIIDTLSTWLYRVTSGWVALLALGGFLMFTALILPAQSKQAEAYAGDIGSPDTSFLYTPRALYAMAEAYGSAGRAAYIRARLTFDVLWPLVYVAFLLSSVSWIYDRVLASESRWRYVNVLPLLGALFDYLENGATALVMARYPAQTPIVDVLAPFFTLVKWAFVTGSFVLLLVGLAMWIGKHVRKASARS